MLPARVTVNVTYAATTVLVEAEDAPNLTEISGNGSADAATKKSSTRGCSGGYYINGLPAETTLTYTFSAPTAGNYTMVMTGRNFTTAIEDLSTACEIKINDVAVNVAGKGWTNQSASNFDVDLGAVTLAANNTMTFKVLADVAYNVFMLDCFTFTPVA